MRDALATALIGGAAGVLSAVITLVFYPWKLRSDLAAAYDKQLQEQRLDAYKQLWAMLEPLARYGREKPLTVSVLRGVSDATRTWYFHVGGIYLTVATREPYFRLKALLQELADDATLGESPDRPVSEQRLAAVIAAGSDLRTHLSDDIGTKRLSRI